MPLALRCSRPGTATPASAWRPSTWYMFASESWLNDWQQGWEMARMPLPCYSLDGRGRKTSRNGGMGAGSMPWTSVSMLRQLSLEWIAITSKAHPQPRLRILLSPVHHQLDERTKKYTVQCGSVHTIDSLQVSSSEQHERRKYAWPRMAEAAQSAAQEDQLHIEMLGAGQEVGRSCCVLTYKGALG